MAIMNIPDFSGVSTPVEKPNENGRAAALSSRPVVLSTEDKASLDAVLTNTQLRATPVPVSGTFFQATQPVSGAFFQATQPVSGAFFQATQQVSGPLTDAQLRAVAVPVSGAFFQATQPVSGAFFQATQPVSGPLTDTQLRAAAVPVSGTFFQATQPVSGAFFQATQPVSLATNTPDVTDRAARLLGIVASITGALPAGANSIGTTLGPALTKGTQGATGYSVQPLKDAGRSRVTIGFFAVAPATADTLLSLVKVTNGVAAAGAASIGVASGKTLRITHITFSLKANAAAAAFATMTLRQNPAGATVIGSQTELRLDLGNTAAVVGAADKVAVALPDGFEFSGTQTLGVSLAAQATTNIISIAISGFEY